MKAKQNCNFWAAYKSVYKFWKQNKTLGHYVCNRLFSLASLTLVWLYFLLCIHKIVCHVLMKRNLYKSCKVCFTISNSCFMCTVYSFTSSNSWLFAHVYSILFINTSLHVFISALYKAGSVFFVSYLGQRWRLFRVRLKSYFWCPWKFHEAICTFTVL